MYSVSFVRLCHCFFFSGSDIIMEEEFEVDQNLNIGQFSFSSCGTTPSKTTSKPPGQLAVSTVSRASGYQKPTDKAPSRTPSRRKAVSRAKWNFKAPAPPGVLRKCTICPNKVYKTLRYYIEHMRMFTKCKVKKLIILFFVHFFHLCFYIVLRKLIYSRCVL